MSTPRRLQNTLKLNIPLAFVGMMAVVAMVVMFAAVGVVGKALRASEESRVAQVAMSIALEMEKRQVYVEQLAESLAAIAQSATSLGERDERLHERLLRASHNEYVVGGGLWPAPFTVEQELERASIAWAKTGAGLIEQTAFNSLERPPYHHSLWYLGSALVDDGCFWSGAYADITTGRPVITCTRAMYSEGVFAGTTSVDVSTAFIDAKLDKHMADVKGYAFIVDRNWRIVAKPDRAALKRQLDFDMGDTDHYFPAYLGTIREKPLFAPVEELIQTNRSAMDAPQLPDVIKEIFAGPATSYLFETPARIRTYLSSNGLSEREPVLALLDKDPVFGDAAEIFIVHMPRVDSYLAIVVPQQFILSKSTSALMDLLPLVLGTIVLGVLLLLAWLRRILISPLNKMVNQLRSESNTPLAKQQTFELQALVSAYNDKQEEAKSSRHNLEEARERYRNMLHNSSEAIAVLNEKGQIVEVNTAFTQLLGRDWESLAQQSFFPFVDEVGRPAFIDWFNVLVEAEEQGVRCEAKIQCFEQCEYLMDVSASISHSDDHLVVTLFMRDISERRKAELAMAKMAVTDNLTGLNNRAGFTQALESLLISAEGDDEKLALLFIDLDYFKEINDTRGHDIGDQLLQLVAKRLRSRRRSSDVVARLGGDEFAVILKYKCGEDMISRISGEIVESLSRSFHIDGAEACRIGASIGISIYPDYADTQAELVRQADIAMYQAKNDGRNTWRFYAQEQAQAHQQRQRLIQDMASAVGNEEFYLEYQPIIDSHGKVAFVEALIRWRHPERGVIPPFEFIPLAEKTGLIVDIGQWVINKACANVRAWHDQGTKVPAVSINVSAVQLQRGNLQQVLEHSLSCHELHSEAVMLEMTESLLLDASYAKDLQAFRHNGCCIAIDDFGTGYSSLSYLQTHPVDYLKIDKAFVAALNERNDNSLCRAIIKLSQGLGAKVIAEGVEEARQFWQLAEMESDYMQGYWIAKPMLAEAVPDWADQFSLPAQ